METIVAALISAAASIAVAWISRTPTKTDSGIYVARQKGPHHGRWVMAMFLIAAWVIVTPIAIHHDFPGVNMFALFVLTGVVAIVWPVNGWEAAAWVLGLHAVNSIAEPIARMVTGYPYPPFGGYRVSGILIITAIGFANALVTGSLSQWRLRARRTTSGIANGHDRLETEQADRSEATTTAASSPDVSLQLERLVQLRTAGGLSEAEFVAAKAKILGRLE